MLNDIMSAIFSVAMVMSQVGAKEYPTQILTGASLIVNEAIASNGKTSVSELKSKLETYMREKGVKFPASFRDQNNDRITLLALFKRERQGGSEDLVAVFSSDNGSKINNWVLYSAKPGKDV